MSGTLTYSTRNLAMPYPEAKRQLLIQVSSAHLSSPECTISKTIKIPRVPLHTTARMSPTRPNNSFTCLSKLSRKYNAPRLICWTSQSSPFIKFATLPKSKPGGDATAIRSAPDHREIECTLQYIITAKTTPKKPP